jgi:hypothetical protein
MAAFWEEMGVAYLIMKVKRANRLMSIIDEIWVIVIHLQKVDTLLMIGI